MNALPQMRLMQLMYISLTWRIVGHHSCSIHTPCDLYSPPNVFFSFFLSFVQVCNMAGALVETVAVCQASYFSPLRWHKYDNRFFELWLQQWELDGKNPLKVTWDWSANTSSFCALCSFPTRNLRVSAETWWARWLARLDRQLFLFREQICRRRPPTHQESNTQVLGLSHLFTEPTCQSWHKPSGEDADFYDCCILLHF